MGSSLSTAEIADSLGTTPRTLRKFLRSPASPFEPVGQGARYNIDSDDMVELKDRFETWVSRPGSRSTSAKVPAQRAPRKPKTKIVEKADPLADDELMVRMTKTVAERQRMHGIICSYEWKHPKVRGLEEKCTRKTQKGTKFCDHHQPIPYCFSDEAPLCGPNFHKPFCDWHSGEMSEEDREELEATEHGQLMLKAAAKKVRELNSGAN